MSEHVVGQFDVRLTAQSAAEGATSAFIGRMTGTKQFHGDLEATSDLEMLSARMPDTGAAVYVAIERVTGTLAGRTGSFVMAHLGTMTKTSSELTVIVAPGSGTGDLAGLGGTMKLVNADGKHSYEFDYSLP